METSSNAGPYRPIVEQLAFQLLDKFDKGIPNYYELITKQDESMTSLQNTTEHNSKRENVSASTIDVDFLKDLTLYHSFNVGKNGYVTLYLPEGVEYNRNRPALVCQYDQDCGNTTTAYCIDCIQLPDSSNYINRYKPICRLCPDD